MATMTVTFIHETSGGVEHEHALPAKMAVCERCEGHGTHLHPDIGGHAFTVDEFNETFHDDEDRAQYFRRGGIYDVPCEACGGQRVVPVVDEDAANRTTRGRRLLALYNAVEDREARYEAERMHERAMGY